LLGYSLLLSYLLTGPYLFYPNPSSSRIQIDRPMEPATTGAAAAGAGGRIGRAGLALRLPLLLLLLPLLLPTATVAFLPPAAQPHAHTHAARRRREAAAVVVGMGGKWQKDPGVLHGVAELVKGFQQRQHQQTETVDRYLQVGGFVGGGGVG
jgi:hypothetical protein